MNYTLEQILTELYKHEINCLIYSEWDAGWTVKLGDPMNGYTESGYFNREDFGEIGLWLIKAVNIVHPHAKLFEDEPVKIVKY
jgi:hypothetical protein